MKLLLFKTDPKTKKKVKSLQPLFSKHTIITNWSIDTEDIDNVFNLFTDDFTYVHPKYGGVYTRQDLYNGYKRNLEKGSYNGSVIDIKITDRIIGLKAATVNKRFIKKEAHQIK